MYDLVVLGAGPGGYVAALKAAQYGLKVAIVERDKVGGVCLNYGCIPTKNLIYQAGIFENQTGLLEMGLKIDRSEFDYEKVVQQMHKAVKVLVSGVEKLLKKRKVTVIHGNGKIASKNKVVTEDGRVIEGRHILIATGSRPTEFNGFEYDEETVLSSNGVLGLKKLPKSIIILGAGPVGCEFAYILNAFGVEVQLVEMENHILPFEDDEIVSVLTSSFIKRGIKVFTGSRAVSLRKGSRGLSVKMREKSGKEKELKADKALCVFGRTPNTEGIGLEEAGIERQNGYVSVGDYYQTKLDGIFAIGDVVATPQLAHVASKEGELVVDYIVGRDSATMIDPNLIISAAYCEPEIASFGLREKEAQEKGIAYQKALFPYSGIGKAVAIGKTEGLVKILTVPETGEILGAHVAGVAATELIHELLLGKVADLIPEDIANMIHAHPTLSEGVMEGMRAVNGHAIHI